MNNTRYYKLENGLYVDIETGECNSRTNFLKLEKEEQQTAVEEKNKKLIELDSFPSKLVLFKGAEYDTKTIKKNNQFSKIFRVEVRKLMMDKDRDLSIYARATIATLEGFISFPSNRVVINSSTPTLEELQKLIKVGRTKLYNIFKELEYYDIIKRKKEGNISVIYFNPFLYCAGKLVEIETYNMFKDSVFNSSNDN